MELQHHLPFLQHRQLLLHLQIIFSATVDEAVETLKTPY